MKTSIKRERPLRRSSSKRRERLPERQTIWSPEWGPEYEGWTINHLKKHHYKLLHTESFEDLMQDAKCVFYKLVDFYPTVVEPRHFMALYKRSYSNIILDKINEAAKSRTYFDFDVPVEDMHHVVGDITNFGELAALLNSGPKELKMFVEALDNPDCIEHILSNSRKENGNRLNLNMLVAEYLGIKAQSFSNDLKTLLSPS